MIEAILFDFGGTLDTNGIHWSEMFRTAYENAKLGITFEDFNEAYVKAESMMYKLIKRNDSFFNTIHTQSFLQLKYLEENKSYNFPGGSSVTSEVIAKNCHDYVLKTIGTVGQLLLSLGKNYKLGVVSNFYGNLEASLESLGIAKFFSVITDSTLAGVSKPDPAIFRAAISKLSEEMVPEKITAENILVVGDSYTRDIGPAKKLGCKTIWLDVRSWERPEKTVSADFIVKDIVEIKEIIHKLSPR